MVGCAHYFILLLPLVDRCIEKIDACIWRMFVFMYVVVTVWCRWECGCVAGVLEDSGFYSLGVLNYVLCLCRGCHGFGCSV